MAKGKVLSPDTAARVLKATEIVERQQRNPQHEPPRTRKPTQNFFARITGSDSSGRYDWEVVNMNFFGDMTATPDQMTGKVSDGTGFAVELHKSKWVLEGDVVELKGSRTYPVLIFDYAPGVQPGTAYTTITKRSGNTPGQGQDTVTRYDSTSGDMTAGQTVMAYNSFDSSVDSGHRVHITFGDGGLWWVTAEEC